MIAADWVTVRMRPWPRPTLVNPKPRNPRDSADHNCRLACNRRPVCLDFQGSQIDNVNAADVTAIFVTSPNIVDALAGQKSPGPQACGNCPAYRGGQLPRVLETAPHPRLWLLPVLTRTGNHRRQPGRMPVLHQALGKSAPYRRRVARRAGIGRHYRGG